MQEAEMREIAMCEVHKGEDMQKIKNALRERQLLWGKNKNKSIKL